jgi:hypothetical protein
LRSRDNRAAIAAFLFQVGGASEGSKRGGAGICRAHSCGDVLGRLLFEVKLQLRVELPFEPLSPEHRT